MKKVIFTSVLFCLVAFSASAQKQKSEELRKKQAATPPPPATAKLAVKANKTQPTDQSSSFSDAVSKMPQQTNAQQANKTNNVSANSKTGTTAPKVAADTKAKQN